MEIVEMFYIMELVVYLKQIIKLPNRDVFIRFDGWVEQWMAWWWIIELMGWVDYWRWMGGWMDRTQMNEYLDYKKDEELLNGWTNGRMGELIKFN